MKKIVIRVIIALFIMFITMDNSMAMDKLNGVYYKNSNGVVLSEKEYQFVNQFYGSNYFETMTLEDYKWIQDLKIDQNEIEIKSSSNTNILPFGTSTTQNGRNIQIVKSCSGNCIIIVKCQWNSIPSVKSYDVMGARFVDTDLASDVITTRISSTSGTEYSSDLVRLTRGFGVSVKVPSGSNISVEQKYTVTKGGTIYATHQHAKQNITLATSKLYTITSSGYGRVFGFYGSALNVFDQMNGVDISL